MVSTKRTSKAVAPTPKKPRVDPAVQRRKEAAAPTPKRPQRAAHRRKEAAAPTPKKPHRAAHRRKEAAAPTPKKPHRAAHRRKEAVAPTPKTPPSVDRAFQHRKEAVVAGLKEGPLPVHAIRMVSGLLQKSLHVFKDLRHDYQQRAIDIVGRALVKTESFLVHEVEDAQAAVTAAQERKAKAEAEMEEAKQDAEAKEEIVRKQKRALAEEARAYLDAKKEMEKVDVDRSVRQKKTEVVGNKRARLEEATSEFKKLTSGSEVEAQRLLLLESLIQVLKHFGVENSLIVSLPKVLSKAPGARSEFDKTVIESVEQEMRQRIAEWDREAQRCKDEEAADSSRTRATQTAFHGAQARQLDAADKYSACSTELERAQSARANAESAAKAAEKQAEQGCQDLAKFEKKLERFRNGALKFFCELRDRETPSPTPPQPEEMVEESSPTFRKADGSKRIDVEAQQVDAVHAEAIGL